MVDFLLNLLDLSINGAPSPVYSTAGSTTPVFGRFESLQGTTVARGTVHPCIFMHCTDAAALSGRRQPYGAAGYRRSAGGGFTNFSNYGSYGSRCVPR
jgi:hypothetical protein